jgi:RNA-directed DNA polymerase
MREELYEFLNTTLRLNLATEKTRITHLNDGLRFLGFELRRHRGGHGRMTTKVLIPKSAMEKMKAQISRALAPSTHQDSVKAKAQFAFRGAT